MKKGHVENVAEKAIQISEKKTLCYRVEFLEPYENCGRTTMELTEISASIIEGHYVLRVIRFNYSKSTTYRSDYQELFGVSHTPEEADEQLYDRAKEVAEKMAREFDVISLEDLTKQHQRLPHD
ncbi:MAG: hypothetical protein Q8R53_05000 [Nanoarchaeota archaeon]|nr:hypothetical protein [Nanoarchaeota archaeon]